MTLALIAALLAPPPAVTPLKGHQLELHLAAEDAYKARDFKGAGDNLRASLALGDYRQGWLWLGNLLRDQGECGPASQAFDNAESARATGLVSEQELAFELRANRALLSTQCAGVLIVRCPPSHTTFRIEGDPETHLCGRPLERMAGAVKLVGELRGERDVVGLEERVLRATLNPLALSVAPPPEPAPELAAKTPPAAVAAPEPVPESEDDDTLAWTLTAAGGAVLATAIGLEFARARHTDDIGAARERGDRAAEINAVNDQNALQEWGRWTWAAGAVLTATGLTLMVF